MTPIKLHYRIIGSGKPLVLVHGYPLSSHIWDKLEPHLCRHAQMILPDLRGFGESPATDGIYTMKILAEDLIALLDSLGHKQAFFAGHSMGGYVCLALAHYFPERVSGLALVASQANADSTEKRKARLEMIESVKRVGTEAVFTSMIDRLTEKEKLKPEILAIMRTSSLEGIIGTLAGMAAREDAVPWLHDLNFPVAIIAGAKDKIIPLEQADELKKLISKSTSIILRQAGHMPMMEEPASTASGLLWLIKQAELHK